MRVFPCYLLASVFLKFFLTISFGLFHVKHFSQMSDDFWLFIIFKCWKQALVAHTSNPSYVGGTEQEDFGLKPVLGKYF
jgi:hypothetical protein